MQIKKFEQEKEECTGRPQISQKSKQMIRNQRFAPLYLRTNRYLQQKEKRLMKLKQQIDEERDFQEDEELTF